MSTAAQRETWWSLLPPLIPARRIRAFIDKDDDEELAAYQESVWLSSGLLKALHIEPELKAALAEIVPGLQVLDVGSGCGAKSQFMLEMGAASVIGAELDADELALAHSLPNPFGAALRFDEIDLSEPLSYSDGQFDLIFIGDPYIDFYDVAILDELWRVLRRGGHFVMATTNILPPTLYSFDRAFAARVEAARWASMAESAYAAQVIQTGESYESLFVRATQHLGLSVRHVPVIRQNPVPPAFETLTQQLFAAFHAHLLRPHLDPADWRRLCELHDPASDAYLFRRADALFVDLLTIAAGRRE